MARKVLALIATTAVITGFVGIVPALAGHGFPYVTIDVAPEGAEVAPGEHFEGVEFTNSRPLAAGGVGSLPVFFADDEYGCNYATAAASGESDWIALARRGLTEVEGLDQCAGFQTKLTTATAAGADGLIVINHSPGAEAGTAVGEIPALMIDHGQGNRLVASLDPANPDTVKVTLDLLDPDTFLPGHPLEPSTVNSVQATPSGGTLSVSGNASFRGEGPVLVAEDGTGDGPLHPETASDAGVDIVGAYISQPDPGVAELLFEWEVTELPDTGSLPEIIRYGFPFKAEDAGFMAQAKFSNVVSGTFQDDPQGHVEHVAGDAFQLRGGCAPDDAGVIACAHVEWLTGEFDTASNRVKIYVPIAGPNTPTVQPGVEIVPNPDSLGGNPTASFQAYVSNNTTEDEALWDGIAYTVPDPAVLLEVLPATGSSVLRSGNASVSGGSFSGSVDVNGLAPGTYDLRTTACFGTNCGAKTTAFTL